MDMSKGLDFYAGVHSEKGVRSFNVIPGILPVVTTPNSGLCSSTGQRVQVCAHYRVTMCVSLNGGEFCHPTKADFFCLFSYFQYMSPERCSAQRETVQ